MTDSRGVRAEFQGSNLGDVRNDRRLLEIAEVLGTFPEVSFPQACVGNDPLLCALYGLLGNPDVEPLDLLAVHFQLSLARARLSLVTYVAHDTTEVIHPESLLHLFLHLAFCTGSPTSAYSAGVVGAEFGVRAKKPKRKGPKRSSKARKQDPERESLRWSRLVLDVHQRAGAAASQLIHLMDREGDIYELLCMMVQHHIRFIVRCKSNRAAVNEEGERDLLFPLLEQAQGRFTRSVPLSDRADPWSEKDRKTHPKRDERLAELSCASQAFTICMPVACVDKTLPKTLTLHYVHVWEEKPPEGEKAVDWKLVTLEPIGTQAEVEAVVDGYRKRWPIEELNKGLKTGCRTEKTLLENPEAVKNHVAIMLPIAWKLVQLRNLERANPEAEATEVLSPVEVEVLRATSDTVLSEKPTIRAALWAVAQLGGHLKRNGPPGWITLMRGYSELLSRTVGWVAATRRSTPSSASP